MIARNKQYLCCGGKNCMSTLCKNITNIESSGNLLKANSRYFLCLPKGHLKEQCKINYACARCETKDHNVSISDKKKKW